MSNLAMKLDTLSYAKKLIAAGCEPKLAEAHASLQQDVLVEISEDYLSQLATKQDLDAHRIATKHDIEELRIATKQDLDAHRIATKHDIEELKITTKQDLDAHRIATKHDIEELRIATKQEFAILRKEMNILFYKIVITLGTIVLAVGGILLKFII